MTLTTPHSVSQCTRLILFPYTLAASSSMAWLLFATVERQFGSSLPDVYGVI